MRPSLEDQATEFAEDLTTTVRAVVGPNCPPFRLQMLDKAIAVSQSPELGIVLNRGSEPLVTLSADYDCVWDRRGQYLKIDKSTIAL